MELQDLIVESALAGLELQDKSGSMPSGINGPWNDSETPVRNTSHWLITFLKAYNITDNDQFHEAAVNAVEYLQSDETRPQGKTFYHRKNPEKDFCNGLIGQAWTFEALATATRELGDPKPESLAETVFLRHPFDYERGLWQTVEITGEELGYDMTFNHQLWFAATGAMLSDEDILEQVDIFLNNLEKNIRLYGNGLIYHKVWRDFSVGDHVRYLTGGKDLEFGLRRYRDIARTLFSRNNYDEQLVNRSIGYHSFNTYAFAMLKERFPDHDFWESEEVKLILKYSRSNEYYKAIQDNDYGYPYNPPGFENAYTLSVFEPNSQTKQKKWVEEQVDRTFDFESGLLESVPTDTTTYAARIYEATRLPNIEFEPNHDAKPE